MKGIIRVFKELDLADIEKHLLVVGDLSSECYSCHKIGIGLHSTVCPNCGVGFKYIGFRRRLTPSYLIKVKEELSHMTFIDFDDFKKSLGKRDARKLLDI